MVCNILFYTRVYTVLCSIRLRDYTVQFTGCTLRVYAFPERYVYYGLTKRVYLTPVRVRTLHIHVQTYVVGH